MSGRPNLFTIPATSPFAETLAKGLLARIGKDPLALSQAIIYLPTRRAARSFGDAFANALGGAALLPSFRPLGDVDEDEMLLDGSEETFLLPPAISAPRRRLLLATLVRGWHAAKRGEDISFVQATALADSLAALMDEIETHDADLARLDTLVPSALAEHWADVKDFLALIEKEWPKILESERAMNPAARRDRAIDALRARLERTQPGRLILAAGSTGSIPATARLLSVIARLPNGAVILPGLDRALDKESWARLDDDPGHPQFGMKQLLAGIGAEREDVADWSGAAAAPSPRETLISETLRPAPTTDFWRALAEDVTSAIADGVRGLSLLECADATEESSTIALILRHALETKGKTAALVTPDRGLARRVAAELGRFDIAIDDSAGRPLSATPPGSFLCLLADAADLEFAPVPLLALLKHPLAALGEDQADFRRNARALDLALRGPRPDSGLDGIMQALAHGTTGAALAAWFDRIADALAPFERLLRKNTSTLEELIRAHVEAAERLSASATGEIQLWQADAGEAAATMIASWLDAAKDLPEIETSSYAALFRKAASEGVVRPKFNRHPRLAILGPLEARLLRHDLVVLGALNEGSWPGAASADPWLSRPMRKAIGLDAPERAIGLSAHDFAALASGPEVILTRAQKTEGAPAIASRWLQRLVQLAKGLGFEAALRASDSYLQLARALANPPREEPMERPAPRPPVEARPRKLSVTEIETWLRDPYAIYAKHVLGLRKLDALDAAIGPLERGTAIHAALERFVRDFPGALPPDAALVLMRIADEIFRDMAVPKAVLALWRPRFAKAAESFVRHETLRRADIDHSFVEVEGKLRFGDGVREFVLRGRADRIDILNSGGGLILDYKSGAPPSDKQVRELLNPQLPLEAAMLADGGFEGVPAAKPEGLVYVRFGSGDWDSPFKTVNEDASALAEDAREKLRQRIDWFDEKATAYYPRVMPYRSDSQGDYDHLARVREWSLTGNGAEDEA